MKEKLSIYTIISLNRITTDIIHHIYEWDKNNGTN